MTHPNILRGELAHYREELSVLEKGPITDLAAARRRQYRREIERLIGEILDAERGGVVAG